MVNYIHYFIRNISGEKGGLIYPSEIQDKNYSTIGGLYIIDEKKTSPKEKYIIHAIRKEEIVELELNRVANSIFSTSVEGIGVFEFRSENVSMTKYTGTNSEIAGSIILKRLRLSDANNAEKAFMRDKFYFIGYSDAVG